MSKLDGLGTSVRSESSFDQVVLTGSQTKETASVASEDIAKSSLAVAASVPLPDSEPPTPVGPNATLTDVVQSAPGTLPNQLNLAVSHSLQLPESPQGASSSGPEVQQRPTELRPASLRADAEIHPASQQQGQTAEFNLLAGKTLGEVSNILSEASSFASIANLLSAAVGTGITGESMFAIGGAWQAGAAASQLTKLFSSASTPEDQKQLLMKSVDLMRGVSNTISGLTGAAVFNPNTNPVAGKISSVTWALSEGANVLQQTAEAISKGRTLDKEQLVHLGQIVGSGLKFAGIVASLSGVSGNGPIISEVVGSAAGISSGLLNLQNKGYDVTSTVSGYYNTFVDYLRNMSGRTGSQPQRRESDREMV
jgi:hypothetical protein